MLSYVKSPRSVTEFTLMKGVTDFTNLRQFDMFETSYGFLVICSVPKFMDLLAGRDARVKTLQDTFVHILEGEFKGISGLPDVTADPATISNGVNELQLINNVTQDTSITISMSYYERSGWPLVKYARYYLTGIKDPNSKAKTYHGLIADGTVLDPGPDYETFTMMYYVTDNTCRKLEQAYLLANCQITSAPMSTLFNASRGDINFPEIEINFSCFPIVSDRIDLLANKMLEYSLNTTNSDRLVLDSEDFNYDVFERSVTGGSSIISTKLESVADATIENKYKIAEPSER